MNLASSFEPREPIFLDRFGNLCSNYERKTRYGVRARQYRRFIVFSGSHGVMKERMGWVAFGPTPGTATISGHHTGDEALKRAEESACWLEDQEKES